VRGDMLYVALSLAAFSLWANDTEGSRGVSAALCTLGVASLAKQPAELVTTLIVLLFAWRRQWRLFVLGIALLGVHLAGHCLLNSRTNGWYGFWVWRVPTRHAILWTSLVPGGLARVAWAAGIPVLIAFAGGALASPLARRGTRRASQDLVWSTALVTTF